VPNPLQILCKKLRFFPSAPPKKSFAKKGALEIGENFFIILAVLDDKVLNQNLDIYLLL
jgi:hypothetical protein